MTIHRRAASQNLRPKDSTLRVQKANRRLKESGGGVILVRLSREAMLSLKRAMKFEGAPETKTALIEKLLIQHAERRRNKR